MEDYDPTRRREPLLAFSLLVDQVGLSIKNGRQILGFQQRFKRESAPSTFKDGRLKKKFHITVGKVRTRPWALFFRRGGGEGSEGEQEKGRSRIHSSVVLLA